MKNLFIILLVINATAVKAQLPNGMLYICGSSGSTGIDSVYYELYSCGDTMGEPVQFTGVIREVSQVVGDSFVFNNTIVVKPFQIRIQTLKPNTTYSGTIYVNAPGHTLDSLGYFISFKTQPKSTNIFDDDEKANAIFPNPFLNEINITTEEKSSIFYLSDITGQQILLSSLRVGLNTISTERIPAGMYILTCQDSKGNLITKKVLKE